MWLRALAVLTLLPTTYALAETRPLQVDDSFAIKGVDDPRVSPDAQWVAYTVTTDSLEKDKSDRDVWMTPLPGGEAIRITSSDKSESQPRFSPDGRYLAFLSGREGDHTQLWLLDRRGGEAQKLTDYKASVDSFAWSPDSKRLALVVSDVESDAADDADKTEQPIVVHRLKFKRDGKGYLNEIRSHIHVFDVAAKTSLQVTSGPYDDDQLAWSPAGDWIAFASNRTSEPDANENSDIFVVAPKEGQVPRAVTSSPGSDASPAWSPDGKWIAFVEGGPLPQDTIYTSNHLAVISATGGAPTPLTATLDRNVLRPRFTPDGRFILFIVEDSGHQHLARVPAAGGPIDRPVSGERTVSAYDLGPQGEIVVLESTPQYPAELSAVTPQGLRRITNVNDAFLEGIALAKVQKLQATSPDGTKLDFFLTLPPDYKPGTRIPLLLRPHGGPQQQDSAEFDFGWQFLAASGYAVVAPNYRGSTGYGKAFSRAIWAGWGEKDLMDNIAAVDHVIGMGIGDPERLGVGGWSYGGYLTNYSITKTNRFKAAVAGASGFSMSANYGTDDLQYWWETELGLPWKNAALWDRLSPMFDVDKVTAPTLVLCGAADMRVPLLNSEQLFQSLRRRGIATELVIYPGEYHSIDTPSYRKDRFVRSLAWYDRYLMPGVARGPIEATSLLGRPLATPPLAAEAKKSAEENLAKAQAEFARNPDSADALLWVGRRLAYLGRYREAIEVFSKGIVRWPEDVRLYRHRGHRYVTLREFDKAIADLSKGVEIVKAKGLPDEPELDGQGVATDTTQSNLWYHLGLAHYLKGDFEKALVAYREGMKTNGDSPDRTASMSDWLYMTLRRLGRSDEAARLLEGVGANLAVRQYHVYWNRLRMYKGEITPEALLTAGGSEIDRATYGYAVGNWYLVNGQQDKAKALFEKIIGGASWIPFGFIASEAELARMR